MLKTLTLMAALLVAGTASAHGDADKAAPRPFDARKVQTTDFGREGDPKKVSRTVTVEMADTMRFTPATLTIKRGETVRFVVRNQGRQLHEMVLGTPQALKEHAELMKRFPGMEHDEPSMAHVKPGAKGEIVWQFTQAGDFQFACLVPGHYEAGMVGTITVR